MDSKVGSLFQSAADEGLLSGEAMNALAVVDIGEQIQAALGINVDDVAASEVVLVTIMPDDSGSIRFGGNAQAVRDGQNLVIDALAASKQKDGILIHNRYLNGQILYPYCPINQAVKMDQGNYNPNGGTPLYDQTVMLLGTVIAKSQEFYDNGVPVRSITLIISDGEDVSSVRADARMVKSIVDDMLKTERNIVAAMGVDNGQVDFRSIFREMGIPDEWILLPGNNGSDIRKAFQLFSQSAVRASQSAANFSAAAIGGFGG